MGLCEDYRDSTACEEEELNITPQFALAAGYTHASLTNSQALIPSAYYIEETLTLESGYDASHEGNYQGAVRHMLPSPVVGIPVQRNISTILLFLDGTEEPRFNEALQGVIDDVLGGQVEMVE